MRLSVNAVPGLVEQLMEKQASKRRDFDGDAIVSGLDVAIGSVPAIGNVYSAARALWNIGRARRKADKTRDVELNFVESYRDWLRLWKAPAVAF